MRGMSEARMWSGRGGVGIEKRSMKMKMEWSIRIITSSHTSAISSPLSTIKNSYAALTSFPTSLIFLLIVLNSLRVSTIAPYRRWYLTSSSSESSSPPRAIATGLDIMASCSRSKIRSEHSATSETRVQWVGFGLELETCHADF